MKTSYWEKIIMTGFVVVAGVLLVWRAAVQGGEQFNCGEGVRGWVQGEVRNFPGEKAEGKCAEEGGWVCGKEVEGGVDYFRLKEEGQEWVVVREKGAEVEGGVIKKGEEVVVEGGCRVSGGGRWVYEADRVRKSGEENDWLVFGLEVLLVLVGLVGVGWVYKRGKEEKEKKGEGGEERREEGGAEKKVGEANWTHVHGVERYLKKGGDDSPTPEKEI